MGVGMKQALFVVSGVAIGLLVALAEVALSKTDFITRAEAQAGPASGGANGPSVVVGTGGGSNNVNDLCWVVSKVKPARGPERMVLALYRAKRGGDYFDLEDVRMIDADLRIIDMKAPEHKRANSDVQSILKSLPREESDPLKPPHE
jgi:hypothetical protein